jgi:hypothetical protein
LGALPLLLGAAFTAVDGAERTVRRRTCGPPPPLPPLLLLLLLLLLLGGLLPL